MQTIVLFGLKNIKIQRFLIDKKYIQLAGINITIDNWFGHKCLALIWDELFNRILATDGLHLVAEAFTPLTKVGVIYAPSLSVDDHVKGDWNNPDRTASANSMICPLFLLCARILN